LSPFPTRSPVCSMQVLQHFTNAQIPCEKKKKLLLVHAKPVTHFFIGSASHSAYSLLECHESQAAGSVRVKRTLPQLQAITEFTGLDTITNHKTDERKLFLLHDCVQQSCNLCSLCQHHETHVATSTTQKFMLLTHTDALLCLQLHTVGSQSAFTLSSFFHLTHSLWYKAHAHISC